MPGRPITVQQAELYMAHREGLGQAGAAAKAGISERSARRLDRRGGQVAGPVVRHWRTREDPLSAVWAAEVEPWLRREDGAQVQGRTVLAWLQREHPGVYPDSLLRTVQRRLSVWRVRHGSGPTAMFPQTEEPGRIGYSDFTHASELGVTIGGEPFPHMLYQFRLGFSGWMHVEVVLGGESFAALGGGLRAALAALGGAPRLHRTDSLSAAFRNLERGAADDLTRGYRQLCADFGMQPTRNNPGVSHENGAIESPNGHLKDDLGQALCLRGSRDFAEVDAYRAWVADHVAAKRAGLDPGRMTAERAALQPLPAVMPSPAAVARTVDVRVSSHSSIAVGKVLYTVDERFIGQMLRVQVYDDRVECFWRGERVEVLPRRPRQGDRRERVVNYHHVIESLVRKPGAFPRLAYRDQVHPTPVWRQTWEALAAALDERAASRTYLGLLLIAHRAGCEEALGAELARLRAADQLPDLDDLRTRFLPPHAAEPPPILVIIPDASVYDQLLSLAWTHHPPKEAS
jgi:transposase InsO family protein